MALREKRCPRCKLKFRFRDTSLLLGSTEAARKRDEEMYHPETGWWPCPACRADAQATDYERRARKHREFARRWREAAKQRKENQS